MEKHATHLAELFATDAEAFSRLPLPTETAAAVREDIGPIGSAGLQVFAMGDFLTTLYGALDVPLADILRSGWHSLVELQEYRDSRKHPSDKTCIVEVGKHKTTSKHRPTVTILMNEQQIAALTFDVQLTLQVTSTVLVVRAGRIWQARGSKFQGEAALSYRGFSLMKRRTGPLTLPGAIDIPDGIPIPPLPEAVG